METCIACGKDIREFEDYIPVTGGPDDPVDLGYVHDACLEPLEDKQALIGADHYAIDLYPDRHVLDY